MTIQIDLNDAIFALSDALDLVGIDEVAHGKRVGYMAFKCMEFKGEPKTRRERLFQLGLLHDCGVSSTQVHQHLVEELQWQHAEEHAITGADLLHHSDHLQSFADAVRHHHTPWRQLTDINAVDEATKQDSNLIFLVDRVDALAAAHLQVDLLDQADAIRSTIAELSGDLFSPQAVDCFMQTSASDSFWLMLEVPHLERFLHDVRRMSDPLMIANEDVKDIARIFARIVDDKSRFTYEHSVGVASLSRYIAQRNGYSSDELDKIEIAGLLHDLGKLRIPDEILDKPDRLDRQDEQTMHRHSFETYQVLRRINGFSEIALWAAYHHEKPDGSGYPFRRVGEELSPEARIIAVADIFQALLQNRPYRKAMSIDSANDILRRMADHGHLDADLVDFVVKHADECHRRATQAATG